MSGRVSRAEHLAVALGDEGPALVEDGFRFLAWNSTSASVIGTKPQFVSQAAL